VVRKEKPCFCRTVEELPIEYQRVMTTCQGYLELGMPAEALREIKALPETVATQPVVLEMHVVVLIRAERWKAALRMARLLCREQPSQPAGFIHTAFCQHALGDTVGARETLLKGPHTLQREGTYFYNLACYDAVLGNLDSARQYLARSIRLDKRFREFARKDRDLAALHAELK
jgi:predicted Zn-dependent protease